MLPLEAICGIIGGRLEHSLTPKLMNHLAVLEGSEERFRAIQLSTDELGQFFEDLRKRGGACLNVTVPHKTDVLQYLDEISGDAEDANAVNIVKGESGMLRGYNSDIEGFLSAREFLADVASRASSADVPPTALILGSGGAASAAAVGLSRLWGEGKIVFLCRSLGKAETRAVQLSDRFAESGMSYIPTGSTEDALKHVFASKGDPALLLNATPIGQFPDGGEDAFSVFNLDDPDLVDFSHYYDAVYNPAVTAGMKRMSGMGVESLGGLEWFIRQAVLSAEVFIGRRPSEEIIRSFVRKELGLKD